MDTRINTPPPSTPMDASSFSKDKGISAPLLIDALSRLEAADKMLMASAAQIGLSNDTVGSSHTDVHCSEEGRR